MEYLAGLHEVGFCPSSAGAFNPVPVNCLKCAVRPAIFVFAVFPDVVGVVCCRDVARYMRCNPKVADTK
jgi:hypothetical protein